METFFKVVAGIICIVAFFFFFGHKLPAYHNFTFRQKCAWNLGEFTFFSGVGYLLYAYNEIPWWGAVLVVCVTPFNLLLPFILAPTKTTETPPQAPEPQPPPEPTVEEKVEELLKQNKR